MSTNSKATGGLLKRTLGLTTLIAIGVGQVIGQGAFVSLLQGVGINGTGFMIDHNVVILLMISSAAVWLLVYIMAHIDLIILRKKYPQFHRPYQSPLFPVFQIMGIVAMIYLIINNSPSPEMTKSVYLNAGLFVGITALYAILWIKFKMQKEFFQTEPIENIS